MASQRLGVLRLSDLDPEIGFGLFTDIPQDGLERDQDGARVTSLGDINGDGFDDFGVLIAKRIDGFSRGTAYVLFGSENTNLVNIQLDNLTQQDGFQISSSIVFQWSESSISSAGDINNDGFDDIIVGIPLSTIGFGQELPTAYVIYGGNLRLSDIDLANLPIESGFALFAPLRPVDADFDFAGKSVASAGDINGDGIDDLVIGAPGRFPDNPNSSRAYVVFGRDGKFSSDVQLANLSANDGFSIVGSSISDRTGFDVSSAGDINGDGIADLLVSAPFSNSGGGGAGVVYVIYGKSTLGPTIFLNQLTRADGFRIIGTPAAFAGQSVSAAGDVNGDGLDDIILGSGEGQPGNFGGGTAYLIFGQAEPSRNDITLVNLDAKDGFRILPGGVGELFANSVAGAGDVNGDGVNDVLIGAYGADLGTTINTGKAYVVFGRSDGDFSKIDLNNLSAEQGLIIFSGENSLSLGQNVSGAGDVNNDGLSDIIIGSASNAYLIFGRNNFGEVPNTFPIAQSDAFKVIDGPNTPFFLDVLKNDFDQNGDAITILSFEIPNNGTLTLNVDQTFSYKANANFSGIDTFKYTISDGNGGSSQAQVSIETIVTTKPANIAGITTIKEGEDAANRINIVFLGDGYTQSDIGSAYLNDVMSLVKYMKEGGLIAEPFSKYFDFFNIYAINLISQESGVDRLDLGQLFDTALDAKRDSNGSLVVDFQVYQSVLEQAFKDSTIIPHITPVPINIVQDNFGEGAAIYGGFAVYSAESNLALEIALHEIGHSFGLLADEYGGFGLDFTLGLGPVYDGPEPTFVNVTTDPTGGKWEQWLGYDQPGIGIIGAYEGGFYREEGIFRPSDTSKMRALGNPFDAIAREQFILKFYEIVDPIDFHTPAGAIENPSELTVNVIDVNVIEIRWSIDGIVVSDGDIENFNFSDFNIPSGLYEVTAVAYDPTNWVRVEDRSSLEQSVSWSVTLSVATLFSAGATPLIGGLYRDIMNGDALANVLIGMAGDDELIGGGGNDKLDGGEGIDTAVFAGTLADYRFLKLDDGLEVRGIGVAAVDGSDQISKIEFLAFADQTISVADVIFSPAVILTSNGGGDTASVKVGEGQTLVTQVSATGTNVAYAISGGADSGRFAINTLTGRLTFVAAPDFEQPADSNGDNVYEVIVGASDGSLGDTQTLSVTVEDRTVAPRLITLDGFAGGVGGTTAVFLTSGSQDIAIIDAPGTITLSGPPGGDDIIRFTGAASAYNITRVGSRVEIADSDTVVSIPVSPTGINVVFGDGPRTLAIVAGQIRIGSQLANNTPAAVTALAEPDPLPNLADPAVRGRLIVAEGSPVTVAGKIDVFGTSFDNELFVAAGGDIAIRSGFTGGMDTVGFDGAASGFTAARLGSTVFIEGAGTRVSIPVSPGGTKLTFADGERLLRIDTATGKVLLGDQELGSTQAPLAGSMQTILIDASDITVSISPNGGDLMALSPSSFEEWLAFVGAGSSAGPQRLIDMAEGGSLADTQRDLRLLLSDVSGFDPLGPADMLRNYYATAYTGMYAQAYLALDDDALMDIHQSGSQFSGVAPSPVMLASFDSFSPGG